MVVILLLGKGLLDYTPVKAFMDAQPRGTLFVVKDVRGVARVAQRHAEACDLPLLTMNDAAAKQRMAPFVTRVVTFED